MTSSPRTASLKINAVSQWLALMVEMAVGLVLTPFIVRELGKDGYGILTVLMAVFGYYGILSMGVDTAVLRYLSHHLTRGERAEASRVLSTAIVGLLCMGLLLVLISLGLSRQLAGFLEVEPDQVATFVRVLRLLALTTLVSFLSSTMIAVLKSRELFVPVNLVVATTTLIRAGLTFLLVARGWGVAGVAVALLVAVTLRLVLMSVLARFKVPDVRFVSDGFRISVLKKLLVYGGGSTLMVIGSRLRFNLYGFVISKTLDVAQVGVFAVAASIVRYIMNIVAVGISVLAPRFTALNAQDDRAGLQALFLRGMAAASEIALAVCTVAGVVGGAFIAFWVGDGFEAAVPVLWILLGGLSIALAQNPGLSLLYALDRHRFYAVVNLVEGLMNLGMCIVLVGPLSLPGIALGITIPLLLNKIFVMPWYIGRLLEMRLRRYWSTMLPSILAGAATLAVVIALGLQKPLAWPPLLDILGRGGLTGVIYLGLVTLLSRWFGGALPVIVEMAVKMVAGIARTSDREVE